MAKYDASDDGYELPDDPIVPFAANAILHFVLQMDRTGKQPYELTYCLKQYPPQNTPKPIDIEAYVTTKAVGRVVPKMITQPTPWNLPIPDKTGQCYVVLDLDPNWANWQFIGQGLTSKTPNNGKDFGLGWVAETATNPWAGEVRGGPINQDGCKRIFFGVARRKAKETGCNMNFLIGFLQSGMMMPVMYDPDVPNLGGKFP